jgi:hypothetical protein
MNLEELKAFIQEYNFDHIFFWWSLEGDGNKFSVQSINSHDKTAIEGLACATGFDWSWSDNEQGKFYFISFF